MGEIEAVDLLATLELIEIAVALIKAVAQLVAVVFGEAAVTRYRTVIAARRILLQIGFQDQMRIFIRLPHQLRHQRIFLFAGVIVLGIAVAGHAGQAKRPLIVDGIGVVKHRAGGGVAARLQLDVTLFAELRTLGDHVHQSARHRLTIERRRGAFDHVDALKEGVIDLQYIVTATIAHQSHAVEEGIIGIAAMEAA